MSLSRVDGLLEEVDELSLREWRVLYAVLTSVNELIEQLPEGVDDSVSFNQLLEEHNIQ